MFLSLTESFVLVCFIFVVLCSFTLPTYTHIYTSTHTHLYTHIYTSTHTNKQKSGWSSYAKTPIFILYSLRETPFPVPLWSTLFTTCCANHNMLGTLSNTARCAFRRQLLYVRHSPICISLLRLNHSLCIILIFVSSIWFPLHPSSLYWRCGNA